MKSSLEIPAIVGMLLFGAAILEMNYRMWWAGTPSARRGRVGFWAGEAWVIVWSMVYLAGGVRNGTIATDVTTERLGLGLSIVAVGLTLLAWSKTRRSTPTRWRRAGWLRRVLRGLIPWTVLAALLSTLMYTVAWVADSVG